MSASTTGQRVQASEKWSWNQALGPGFSMMLQKECKEPCMQPCVNSFSRIGSPVHSSAKDGRDPGCVQMQDFLSPVAE